MRNTFDRAGGGSVSSDGVDRRHRVWRVRTAEAVVYLLALGLAVLGTVNQVHVAWFNTGVVGLVDGPPSNLSPSDLAHLQGSVPAGVGLLVVSVVFYLLKLSVRLALDRSTDRQEAPEEAAFWAADGLEPVEQAHPADAHTVD